MKNEKNMKAISEEDLEKVSGGKENINPDELWFEGTDVDKIDIRSANPASGVMPIIFSATAEGDK